MEINQYEYLWMNDNYEYVLVKTQFGYFITNFITNEVLITENEILENEIINKMLQRGVPIYQSHKDLLNKCDPINIVGQPILQADFPVKRYKVYIEWLKDIPVVVQIKELKKLFLKGNSQSNQELLDIAKKNEKWQFDIMYLEEGQKTEIVNLAEEHGLKVFFELDDLREQF